MSEEEPKKIKKETLEESGEYPIALAKETLNEGELEEKGASKEELEALDRKEKEELKDSFSSWAPKTKLGKAVKSGLENNLDVILEEGKKILEPEIVDHLLNLESDMVLIGQAKGKFGGGKRRAWRQTQKKTMEGNVLSFSAMAIVGDKNGHVGIGFGKARETLPAREKAIRNAKLGITKIKIGFESPEEESENSRPHTIPFKVEGKCGSVGITLWPAPRGTGLVIGDECKKVLTLAGIKDIYSRTRGKTKTTFNLIKACFDALEKTKTEVLK